MRTEEYHHFPDPIRARELEVRVRFEGMEGFLFAGQNGTQVVFWECTTETEVHAHSHDFDEYCIVVEGVCRETIDGKELVLKKGDEILIPAGKVHAARISPPYRAIDFFGGTRFEYKHNAPAQV